MLGNVELVILLVSVLVSAGVWIVVIYLVFPLLVKRMRQQGKSSRSRR